MISPHLAVASRPDLLFSRAGRISGGLTLDTLKRDQRIEVEYRIAPAKATLRGATEDEDIGV